MGVLVETYPVGRQHTNVHEQQEQHGVPCHSEDGGGMNDATRCFRAVATYAVLGKNVPYTWDGWHDGLAHPPGNKTQKAIISFQCTSFFYLAGYRMPSERWLLWCVFLWCVVDGVRAHFKVGIGGGFSLNLKNRNGKIHFES